MLGLVLGVVSYWVLVWGCEGVDCVLGVGEGCWVCSGIVADF